MIDRSQFDYVECQETKGTCHSRITIKVPARRPHLHQLPKETQLKMYFRTADNETDAGYQLENMNSSSKS